MDGYSEVVICELKASKRALYALFDFVLQLSPFGHFKRTLGLFA